MILLISIDLLILNILFSPRNEKKEHMERMKRLEDLYRENVKKMRNTLEGKLRKAALAFEEQRRDRIKKISRYDLQVIIKYRTIMMQQQ